MCVYSQHKTLFSRPPFFYNFFCALILCSLSFWYSWFSFHHNNNGINEVNKIRNDDASWINFSPCKEWLMKKNRARYSTDTSTVPFLLLFFIFFFCSSSFVPISVNCFVICFHVPWLVCHHRIKCAVCMHKSFVS